MEEQRRIATEANHNKLKFLASAAHDLRQAIVAGDACETQRLLALSQSQSQSQFDVVELIDVVKVALGDYARRARHETVKILFAAAAL